MAGAGKAFHDAGYSFPKPLIDIDGKTMIQLVVENINIDGNYIFICKKEHYEEYSMYELLNLISNKCKIIQISEKTEGAAKTLLHAKEMINNDEELIIANSDQWLDWNPNHFLSFLRSKNADGGIVTFISTHPRWSFVKVDNNGLITKVAEKKPISNIATAGIYYFKHGKDFVWAAEQMIQKNIRFNNEFYYAPSFNEMIEKGMKVYSYPAAEMKSLGTPEDVSKFLNSSNKTISTES
ncbi:Bifunctional protein GlmU [Marine Group I thaumarchaeote SCGC AAA799-E16]|uniref:2-aminoethylphosphonate-pyruvate transaminase protein n=2 Tax=Marine Group I TaxID=905826 RepID=A0A087S250_9ARCH|nr:Bifunctional protein GlmU [Marine Group I thaumarchaeote SCGC AAA799-E16]KFM19804.1 2-aminoethylphosphonate-pyruvate transaminase protein [Marine Group I thaumarchaeote SCGC RSA3]